MEVFCPPGRGVVIKITISLPEKRAGGKKEAGKEGAGGS
jgi:hypothetical protein